MYDVLIIGGGCAGLTAALYAARAGKTALVIEKDAFGGQITWSPLVENYPAQKAVSGIELADALTEQALEAGAQAELCEIVKIEKTERGFVLKGSEGESFEGRAVIAAMGAAPRKLNIPGEDELIGNGVSYCAVCDGEFYRGKDVCVSGGGNTALQEALYLSAICEKVYLVHRRTEFRADAALQELLSKKENVEYVLGFNVAELVRDSGRLCAVNVKDDKGAKRELKVQGLFVAIGHVPKNEMIAEYASLDDAGYAAAGEDCAAKTPGLFVAGDCRKKEVRQLTTAAADGAIAAVSACRYADSLRL